ncbi:MAG: hypothetical protein ABSC48_08290 [Terracidiphilus sp.]
MEAIIRWEAQRQAAVGHLTAALEVLHLVDAETGAGTAVLRGKIQGQRGEFLLAAESFRQALAAEPAREDARAGLAAVERLARGPFGGFRLRIRGWLMLALTVAVLGGFAWRSEAAWRASNREVVASLAGFEDKISAADATRQASAETLAARIARLEAEQREQSRASTKAISQLKLQLQRVQSQLSNLQARSATQTRK